MCLVRQAVEGTVLASARVAFGDHQVRQHLARHEYDPEFVDRHSNQLAGLVAGAAGADR